jgi:ribonuclease HII
MLRYERQAWKRGAQLVAGVDEAGRGPLAGPVVAAAVILPRPFHHATLNDSKQLRPELREQIYAELTAHPALCWAVGVCDVARINILRATWQAMQIALDALATRPDHVLIDGLPVPVLTFPQTAIVDGDCKSFSIAAASVIAKVTRDRMMVQWHAQYPDYGFNQHKGYGTPGHYAALAKFGPCPIHRRSFSPIRDALEPRQEDFPQLRPAP